MNKFHESVTISSCDSTCDSPAISCCDGCCDASKENMEDTVQKYVSILDV